MGTYSKELIERRASLIMDDVEHIAKLLNENYPKDAKLHEVIASLMNIEIALDFEDDTSDKWKFYDNGSRAKLNN